MEISKDTQDKIKRVELELLKNFIDVCDKLELEYFAVGGTLLGAIRHGGFIPWDDDIDIGMMRKDYEIFKKEAQRLLPNHIFVQCLETEKSCPFNFIKLRDSNTTFIESSISNLNINHGIYIDIFPYDEYPEDYCKQKRVDLKKIILTKSISRIFNHNSNTEKKTPFSKLTDIISFVLYPNIKNSLYKREKLYTEYNKSDSKLIINYNGAWGKREIAEKVWFKNLKIVPFEDVKLKIPVEYDLYLKKMYGDYMTFPPKEKQISHHYTKVIDVEKPYTYYINR